MQTNAPAPKRTLDFSVIERLDFGKASGAEIVKLFGDPDQVVQLKENLAEDDAWIYAEDKAGQRIQRLSLLVDRKAGTVLTATWSVFEGEPLYLKASALAHFKDIKFIVNKAGRVAPDYYSDDLYYSDSQSGVSMSMSGARQTVNSISFGPSQRRKLAEAQN